MRHLTRTSVAAHRAVLILLGFGVVGWLEWLGPGQANAFQETTKAQPASSSSLKPIKPAITELTLTGRFHVIKGSERGVLILKAEIPKGSCIYALTQKGNPQPSKLKISPSKQFQVLGKFSADRYPKVIEHDPVFETRLEKHTTLVQFFAPIKLVPGVDPKTVTAEMTFDGLCCSDAGTCIPVKGRKVKANFGGYYEKSAEKRKASPNLRR